MVLIAQLKQYALSGGGFLNYLPDPVRFEMDWGDQELPTMSLSYPYDGLFRITGPAEVAVVMSDDGGINFSERRGCRFLLMHTSEDVMADVRVVTYHFMSVGWLMKRALVWDAGADAGDGKRTWTNFPSEVLRDIHTKAELRGWGAGLTLNVPVAGTSAVYETDQNSTLEQVLADICERAGARYYITSRQVNVRFDGSDQTVKSDSFWLGPRERMGMPIEVNYAEHVSHVRIRDKDGAYFTSSGSLTPYGRLELPMTISTAAGSTAAVTAGNAARVASTVTTAYTHEFVALEDSEQSLPWVDFYPGDTIDVFRSDISTVTVRTPMVVQKIHLEFGEATTGHVILGKRWDAATVALFRRAISLNVKGF